MSRPVASVTVANTATVRLPAENVAGGCARRTATTLAHARASAATLTRSIKNSSTETGRWRLLSYARLKPRAPLRRGHARLKPRAPRDYGFAHGPTSGVGCVF